ncbi:MAG: hypothetical protein EYX74_00755 [Desulfobulbaceae bacterium]|nr:MAG: hypothetical protein EYX74_00755 [Desulfobulbaceae bacterium]
MYLDHFNLTQAPFRITPDPAFFFAGGGRGLILEALIYAIKSGEGIIKVVGEVGSGKTMLCRMLLRHLAGVVDLVYIANPSLSSQDILYAIAFELKLPVTRTTERLVVMQLLQDYLLRQHEAGRNVVVFIEEAQGMALKALEEIRLISNLETHRHKLLQIVLFGQPELDNKLRGLNIRQFRERITHSFALQPLSAAETADYLRFRLQASGYNGATLFDARATKLIAGAARGLSRRINILADKALLAAYADSAFTVRAKHVRAAIKDSEFGAVPPSWRPALRRALRRGLALGLILGLIVVVLGLSGLVFYFSGEFGGFFSAAKQGTP